MFPVRFRFSSSSTRGSGAGTPGPHYFLRLPDRFRLQGSRAYDLGSCLLRTAMVRLRSERIMSTPSPAPTPQDPDARPAETTLDHALGLARKGYPLIPLLPGTKRCPLDDWQHRATTDEALIRSWFAPDAIVDGIEFGPDANYGVVAGPTADPNVNLAVVDLDAKPGEPRGVDALLKPRQGSGAGRRSHGRRQPSDL